MLDSFDETEDGWILPLKGTWGTKAKNLYNNRNIILSQGLMIPRSMPYPYEYLQEADGTFNRVLDSIQRYFPDSPNIAIRSSSPDEDAFGRTPGFYRSHSSYLPDRRRTFFDLESVIESYKSPRALERRKRLGLEERGMSLLVQGLIPDITESGCFSDWGEKAQITFTDYRAGIDAMQRPSKAQFYVDSQGEILSDSNPTSDQQGLAKVLRKLTDNLPALKDKGWETEFVANNKGVYTVQTTPIEKKRRFEVIPTEDNIFMNIAVLGTGMFRSQRIIWVPWIIVRNDESRDLIRKIDSQNKDYCLILVHENLNWEVRLLNEIQNANVILDITRGFWEGHPFAPHVEQYMRESRTAIAGIFLGDLEKVFPARLAFRKYRTPILVSDSKLEVQTDEVEQKANVRLINGWKNLRAVS